MGNPYDQDLGKNAANHQPLTPLTYLERAARTYPDHVAIIHGSQRITYRDFWRRSLKLASALSKHGIGKGDTVTVMLSNTPPMLEAHFSVPMTKAVLHSLNTRLDAAVIAFQFDHAETKVAIVDSEFAAVFREALQLAKVRPKVIDFVDDQRLDLCQRQRLFDDGGKFAVDDQHLGLGMVELKGDDGGIEAGVERMQHRPGHRHAEMRLQHRRRVG